MTLAIRRRRRQSGLTLAEVLVALFVLAILSAMGVYALRLAVDGREQFALSDARLRDYQRARIVIQEDLAQIAMRPVRDEFGNPQPASFIGGEGFLFRAATPGERPLVAFVRRGRANPESASPRSDLQYVEYVVVEDGVVRRVRPYLDDARGQRRAEQKLFSGVADARIEFLAGETTAGFQWVTIWPGAASAAPAPTALRLSFTDRRFGDLEQLFWIGAVEGQIGALQ